MADDDRISSLRAAAHPLRLRMLSLLTGSAMSAAEVARELDITHANASYHLRVLRDADLVVIDSEEWIRGGVAKRYRYHADRHETGSTETGSTEDLAGQMAAMCEELRRRFAVGHRGPQAYTDAELWVSEETWKETIDLLRRASLLVHERASSPRTEGTVPVNVTLAAFRMDPS